MRDTHFQVIRKSIPAGKTKAEVTRLAEAATKTIKELKLSRNRAVKVIGEPGANVFDAQVMIASDQQFMNAVNEFIIRNRVNAEYAYQEVLAETMSRLDKAKDPGNAVWPKVPTFLDQRLSRTAIALFWAGDGPRRFEA